MKKPAKILKSEPGRPLLTLHRLRSLAELQSFFQTVCNMTEHGARYSLSTTTSAAPWFDRKVKAVNASGASSSRAALIESDDAGKVGDKGSNLSDREYIEHLLEIDFLEPLI